MNSMANWWHMRSYSKHHRTLHLLMLRFVALLHLYFLLRNVSPNLFQILFIVPALLMPLIKFVDGIIIRQIGAADDTQDRTISPDLPTLHRHTIPLLVLHSIGTLTILPMAVLLNKSGSLTQEPQTTSHLTFLLCKSLMTTRAMITSMSTMAKDYR